VADERNTSVRLARPRLRTSVLPTVLTGVLVLLGCERLPDGGPGGAGGGDGGSGGEDCRSDCSCEYDLPSWEGSVDGLCAPAIASWCVCDELLTAETLRCSPDATACVIFPADCRLGTCGWGFCSLEEELPQDPCPVGVTEELIRSAELRVPCSSDRDCAPPQSCSLRLSDRMFCD